MQSLKLGWVAVLFCLQFIGGCAHYEFDLVRPAELSRHVGDDREQRFSVPPLEYRMQSAEGRLVVKIYNLTGDTVLLLGRRSTVVDAGGESHPLEEEAIAGGSFIKLIFPPLRPRIEPSGPSLGIGFGVMASGRNRSARDAFGGEAMTDQARYFDVYDPGNAAQWDWTGEGDVRLLLAFRQGEHDFQNEFTFHRRKM